MIVHCKCAFNSLEHIFVCLIEQFSLLVNIFDKLFMTVPGLFAGQIINHKCPGIYFYIIYLVQPFEGLLEPNQLTG